MSDKRWVTMADVAREANVSKITVSRVIRTPEKVRPETVNRVQAAIRKLGYIPDQAAGRLATGASKVVAALISTLDGSVFGSTMDGMSSHLRRNGYELLLGTTEYSANIEGILVDAFLGHHPSGIVLTSSQHEPATVQKLRSSGVTVVELWELPDDPIDMAVGFSHFDIGKTMTRFLYDLGYRNIAAIGMSPNVNLRSRLKYEGYLEMHRELGLRAPPPVPFNPEISPVPERGVSSMRWILQNLPDTDAVFCSNDSVALGAISAIRQAGKAVPDDIAVVGIGDFEFSSTNGFGLTTIRIPGKQIGEMAARMIVSGSRSSDERARVIDLGFEIIRRATA